MRYRQEHEIATLRWKNLANEEQDDARDNLNEDYDD